MDTNVDIKIDILRKYCQHAATFLLLERLVTLISVLYRNVFTYFLTYLRHPDAHVSAADQRMHIFANEHLIEPLVSVELCVASRRRPGKRPDSLHPIFAVDEASDPATSLSDHAVAVSSSSFTDMSLRHVFGL